MLVCIVNTGTSILCAQYIGAKKAEDEQNDLITASILMNVGMGVVLNMGLFGIWIAQGLDECFRAVGMGIRWKKKGYTRIEVTK